MSRLCSRATQGVAVPEGNHTPSHADSGGQPLLVQEGVAVEEVGKSEAAKLLQETNGRRWTRRLG